MDGGGFYHDRHMAMLSTDHIRNIGSKAEYASIAKGNAKARCKALYLSAGFGDFGRLAWGIPKSVVDAWVEGFCGVDILPIHI